MYDIVGRAPLSLSGLVDETGADGQWLLLSEWVIRIAVILVI